MLVTVGAGATAGMTFGGDIVGTSTTTVAQSVIVPQGNFSGANVTAPDALVSVNDKGTKFVVGATAYQGGSYRILLPVESRANGAVTMKLIFAQVGGPSSVSIDVSNTTADEFGDGCTVNPVVQSSPTSWRFKLDSPGGNGCKDRLSILISLDADAQPGFYKISGQVKPLEGIE